MDQTRHGLQPLQGAVAARPAGKAAGRPPLQSLALNPYVLFKALGQVKRYSQAELVRAMELVAPLQSTPRFEQHR